MDYKISISPRALREIERAIDFYALNSEDAPRHFVTNLKETQKGDRKINNGYILNSNERQL